MLVCVPGPRVHAPYEMLTPNEFFMKCDAADYYDCYDTGYHWCCSSLVRSVICDCRPIRSPLGNLCDRHGVKIYNLHVLGLRQRYQQLRLLSSLYTHRNSSNAEYPLFVKFDNIMRSHHRSVKECTPEQRCFAASRLLVFVEDRNLHS